MKIAVTYENGQVFQHFGHCEQFKLYDVADGSVTASQVVSAAGSGHGALAGFLQSHGVDTLVCGGIGAGARSALAEAGIQLYPGVTGGADESVAALLAGTLSFDPDTSAPTTTRRATPATAAPAARTSTAAAGTIDPRKEAPDRRAAPIRSLFFCPLHHGCQKGLRQPKRGGS